MFADTVYIVYTVFLCAHLLVSWFPGVFRVCRVSMHRPYVGVWVDGVYLLYVVAISSRPTLYGCCCWSNQHNTLDQCTNGYKLRTNQMYSILRLKYPRLVRARACVRACVRACICNYVFLAHCFYAYSPAAFTVSAADALERKTYSISV